MSAVLQTNYQYRPMQQADLDDIMAIENVIYSHPWSRGNFSDSLNAGYSCWVFEQNSEIIGYSVVMLAADEAHLLNLSVASDRQGQGLGQHLLERIMEISRSHGAQHMFLEVRVSNRVAVKLYEKMGFNEMAIRRNYYPAEHGREDAILMGIAL